VSSAFLGNSLFIFIALTWTIYLVQEMFISGSSALNWTIAKNEKERKQIQYASGLHWDGIEVWLIVALVLTLGAFPLVFATSFTYLYVIFFLLLYVLFTRGIVIETLYKLDNKKWVKANAIAWAVSSALIMFFLGVYLTNLFYGLPFDGDGMTTSFFGAFHVTTISGGLLFFALSIISGAAWIELKTAGELGSRAIAFIKKLLVGPAAVVFLLFVYMGINVQDNSIFVGELFAKYPVLFVLPGLTVLAAIRLVFTIFKGTAKPIFIHSLATMGLFLLTGFVGTYPVLLPSSIDPSFGIAITDSLTQIKSAQIIFFTIVIFYPIIIGYQGWKYMKFNEKVEQTEE